MWTAQRKSFALNSRLSRFIRRHGLAQTARARIFSWSLPGMAPKCWSNWWSSRESPLTPISYHPISFSCQIQRYNRFCAAQAPENSPRVGKGDVGAEADHAEAGGHPLAATECGAGLELASQGSSERDNEQVRSCIQGHGDRAKNQELQKDMTEVGRDELRDEGEKEESSLGIENFSDDALSERAARRSQGF